MLPLITLGVLTGREGDRPNSYHLVTAWPISLTGYEAHVLRTEVQIPVTRAAGRSGCDKV
jgi:hypothetical protein